jgi:hypothetical protein
MFKSLACFAFLIIQLLTVDSFASATDSNSLAAVAAGKEIYGNGIYNKCLPFALGLAQVSTIAIKSLRLVSSTPGSLMRGILSNNFANTEIYEVQERE